MGRLNAEVDWNSFDPEEYRERNYLKLRDDDRQIIELTSAFFAKQELKEAHGVDVGAGSNLYPALAMLPFCTRLDLLDHSGANTEWLNRQLRGYDGAWDQFWSVFQNLPAYARVEDPRGTLNRVASVGRASVFELPVARWGLGTMFFVACSLSTELEEFRQALRVFVRSLKDDAPFAVAFMEKSDGYSVGPTFFPAVAISEIDVAETLAPITYDGVDIKRITSREPLRDGYSGGMILALGRSRST